MNQAREMTRPGEQARERVGLEQYYSEAGPDYAAWSAAFNMHFGYFRPGMNPFDREPMLEQMNLEVLDRLRVPPERRTRLADLGCGVGATMRSIAARLPLADLTGITLVPWQIERGEQLTRASAGGERTRYVRGDYEAAPVASGSCDAVYESSCYATGSAKAALLREAHRLLQPGGRIAVADGFLADDGPTRGLRGKILRKLCECWVIDCLGQLDAFTAELRRLGFVEIEVEYLQYRVAPSVLHIPYVTLKFLFTQVLFGPNRMTRARWNNVIAPALLPFAGKPGRTDALLSRDRNEGLNASREGRADAPFRSSSGRRRRRRRSRVR